MRIVLMRLFVMFIAATGIVGPTGCSKTEEKPNPELQIPDVPPVSSTDGKSKKSLEKK